MGLISTDEKNNIIQEILKELKDKKLINASKSSYKSTEKILYSLNVLPAAVKLIEDEIDKLEKEFLEIKTPSAKSNTLVLKESSNTYIYGDETLETRISELKQIAVKTKSQIRLVKNALKKIEEDPYYRIIPLYYFERKTIEEVAECMNYSVGAISKHKKRLMNELKVYIFPDTFIQEL